MVPSGLAATISNTSGSVSRHRPASTSWRASFGLPPSFLTRCMVMAPS
jgi:hypothetical protein